MQPNSSQPKEKVFQKARLSRDPRFDGKFFTAVKTTGIYCRSTCPATPPKEINVTYYMTAIQAAKDGYRPCLRCRPDSAPLSAAWLGKEAVFQRAIRLIDEGKMVELSLAEFAQFLGVSDRYLRGLFNKYLGTSPKKYQLYKQCLFAKQLIHQTQLPLADIAFASGFNSVRRFNDCFKKLIKMTPTEIRRSSSTATEQGLCVTLNYRPPFNWHQMLGFLQVRQIKGLEFIKKNSYGRTFTYQGQLGYFEINHLPHKYAFKVTLEMTELTHMRAVIANIRRVFDLNADTQVVEFHLNQMLPDSMTFQPGLRIPGIWDVFESGVRAILGQQVSVSAARNLVQILVDNLGLQVKDRLWFPTPEAVLSSDLSFLKMPQSRKNTLKNLAQTLINDPELSPDQWQCIKGIGPWTINYTKIRGLNDPDVYLAGDAGVKQAISKYQLDYLNPEQAAPWRSYLTFHLWSLL